ncbi:MAG: hypothetical protein ABIN79_14770 [Marmoricola sp.]
MGSDLWRGVAAAQDGMISLRQLQQYGVTRSALRNRLSSGRWVRRSAHVVGTTTGDLTARQLMWLGVLHAGNGALVGGLTAAGLYGLRNWERESVTILVPDDWSFDPVPGLTFFRTRRSLDDLRAARAPRAGVLPVCHLEPAVLLFAGYDRSARTAQGVVAAVVQQELTSVEDLRRWLLRMRPLRRSRQLQRVLLDIEGGAQSLAEIDVRRMCRLGGIPLPNRQRPRRDREGKQRFTDCEWHLAGGVVVVLEIDGGFHVGVENYERDMRRQRKITTLRRIVLRCGAIELRDEPEAVLEDLRALGVGSLSA